MTQFLRLGPFFLLGFSAIWLAAQDSAETAAEGANAGITETATQLLFGLALAVIMECMATSLQKAASDAPKAMHVGYANLVRAVNLCVVGNICVIAWALSSVAQVSELWLVAGTLGSMCLTIVIGMVWTSYYIKSQTKPSEMPQGYGAMFYNNPNDNRLWVPKIVGYGWTLNFAHRQAWLLFALLLSPAFLVIARVAISLIAVS